MEIKIGSKFRSFAELDNSIQKYQEKLSRKYRKDDSKSLQSARRTRDRLLDVSEDFKYYRIKYVCEYAGSNWKSRSTGLRNTKTKSQGCPAYVNVLLITGHNENYLEVNSMSEVHICKKIVPKRVRKKQGKAAQTATKKLADEEAAKRLADQKAETEMAVQSMQQSDNDDDNYSTFMNEPMGQRSDLYDPTSQLSFMNAQVQQTQFMNEPQSRISPMKTPQGCPRSSVEGIPKSGDTSFRLLYEKIDQLIMVQQNTIATMNSLSARLEERNAIESNKAASIEKIAEVLIKKFW